MTIAAFFDIDGTLYRDHLMIDHFKKLIKYEVVDSSIWNGDVKKKYELWYEREGDFEEYLLEIALIYIKTIKGLNKKEIEFVTKQTIKLLGDKVYSFTRDRIMWHQQQGHKVIFISGGPDFLVKRMAEKYKVKEYTATKYLTDDKLNFTGELVPMWESKDKIKALEKFVVDYNIDLKLSYAYGDTNGDLSMCKKVGKPHVINPNRKLLDSIKNDSELSKITKVIVERKDIIYELDAFVKTITM